LTRRANHQNRSIIEGDWMKSRTANCARKAVSTPTSNGARSRIDLRPNTLPIEHPRDRHLSAQPFIVASVAKAGIEPV
jgi:hypothetical protein